MNKQKIKQIKTYGRSSLSEKKKKKEKDGWTVGAEYI